MSHTNFHIQLGIETENLASSNTDLSKLKNKPFKGKSWCPIHYIQVHITKEKEDGVKGKDKTERIVVTKFYSYVMFYRSNWKC